jgi:hypothetical protein
MGPDDEKWMAYVNDELDAFCRATGFKQQVRRSWTVREKPVKESSLDDYEWKVFRKPQPDHEFEGEYYLVGVRRAEGRFWVRHSTVHAGVMGAHWDRETVTELNPDGMHVVPKRKPGQPPRVGWLREHLEFLTGKFEPNHYAIT